MQTKLPATFPAHKKLELELVVNMIEKRFPVEMIILFGSYVKGTWVEEEFNEERGNFFRSDFDLLVIVRGENVKEEIEVWEVMKEEKGKTKPRLKVETIAKVNADLKQARYFYSDIYKEGVLLFNSKKYKLNEPREFFQLSAKERLKLAKEYCEEWEDKAEDFIYHFELGLERAKEVAKNSRRKKIALNNSAFFLNQVAESLLVCAGLVYTGYRSPTHNLLKLKERSQEFLPKLENFFFQEDKICKCDILATAYVDARYTDYYKVTAKELQAMQEIVLKLQKLVKKACVKEIERLRD